MQKRYRKHLASVMASVMFVVTSLGTVEAIATEQEIEVLQSGKEDLGAENEEVIEKSLEVTESTYEISEGISEVSSSISEIPGEAPEVSSSISEIPGEAPEVSGSISEIPGEAPEVSGNSSEISGEFHETSETPSEVTEKQENLEMTPDSENAEEKEVEEVTEIPAEALEQMNISVMVESDLKSGILKLSKEAQEIIKAVFTEEEQCQRSTGNVRISAVSMDKMLNGEKALSNEEKAAMEEEQRLLTDWGNGEGYTLKEIFVLHLIKSCNGTEENSIQKISQKIRMCLELSEFLDTTEEFTLVCVKDGQVARCEVMDIENMAFTFESEIFGTYALMYRERTEADENLKEIVSLEVMEGSAIYQSEKEKCWNPLTHQYENISEGQWNYDHGGCEIFLQNHGEETVRVFLSYVPKDAFGEIHAVFKDGQGKDASEIIMSPGEKVTLFLTLEGSLSMEITDEVIGSIAYTYEMAGR